MTEVDSEKENLFLLNVVVSKRPDAQGCFVATPIGVNGERLSCLSYKARTARAAVIGSLKEAIR